MSDKFVPKLVHAIDWAGKISGLVLVIGFVLWQVGAFPFIGKIVEGEFRKQDLLEQVENNTRFRQCWPTGECEGITGLPVDKNQNASIRNIKEAFDKVYDYVREDCEKNLRTEKLESCENLYLELKVYVE